MVSLSPSIPPETLSPLAPARRSVKVVPPPLTGVKGGVATQSKKLKFFEGGSDLIPQSSFIQFIAFPV